MMCIKGSLTSVFTEKLTSIESCFGKGPGAKRRWTPLRYGKVEDSEFILSTSKAMVDMAWHRSRSASNIYTTWMGYNYSTKDVTDFAMHPTFVERYKINETHFANAVDLMMKMDYVMPFLSWTEDESKCISKKHFIWRLLLEDMYDFYKGTVTNTNRSTIHWTKENGSKGNGRRVYSKDICNNLSEKDRKILLKYNTFDYELYSISHAIEAADLTFHEALKRNHS
eukprot:65403_1